MGSHALTRKVVFLEANPFASRLHVLGPLVQAARQAGQEAIVVHPRRVDDAHWREWKAATSAFAGLVPVTSQEEMVPGGGVGERRFRLLLRAAQKEMNAEETLVITALDDVMRESLSQAALFQRLIRKARRTLIIKYRVEDVFLTPKSTRGWSARIATAVAMASRATTLVTFDERFSTRPKVAVLPDPWDGAFGDVSRSQARRSLGIEESIALVGIVGRQDRRKGFPVAVDAAARLHEKDIQFGVLLLGSVPDEHIADLARLKEALDTRLWHETRFVSDLDLPNYFAACDVIWMPYDETFTSTSGVLARAAASGVPVIASDHGLIGHRVREHGLGWVFETTNSSELATRAEECLRGKGANEGRPARSGYDSEHAKTWAAGCSARALIDEAAKILAV
jgi:hypothetical protein